MNKEKKEQIIVIILVPILILGLIYMRSQGSSQGEPQGPVEVVNIVAESGRSNMPVVIPGAPNFSPGENPFTNLLQIFLHDNMYRKEPEKEIQQPLPDFVIQGIVWNTDTPQAIINGQVVKIGDNMQGVKIIGIEQKGILIEYIGERMLIKKTKQGDAKNEKNIQ
jgi:hypothetical protein